MRRIQRLAAASALIVLAGCSATTGTASSSSPNSRSAGAVATATPRPAVGPTGAGTAPPQPNFQIDLPAGWQGGTLEPSTLESLADGLEASWPAVSSQLRTVAAGGPGPFQPNTQYLAYSLRPADLRDYPTGFNVVAYDGPRDTACDGKGLADQPPPGLELAESRSVPLPIGGSWQVRFTFMPPGAPSGTVVSGETWVMTGRGASYELYFETLDRLRPALDDVVMSILRSFRERVPSVAPSPPPGEPFAVYPHADLALEADLPQLALGRPLCTWSTDGPTALEIEPDGFAARALRELGLPADAITYGVAGRLDTTRDPPYIVTAARFRGATKDQMAILLRGCHCSTQRIDGVTVDLVSSPDVPGHAEGQGYLLALGNTLVFIQTAEPSWLTDVVGQLVRNAAP